MASSVDDDFSLLDDHPTNPNHHHVLHHHSSYAQIHAPPPDNQDADDDSDSAFRGANFGNNNNSNNKATSSDVRIEKRRDQEEIHDGVLKRPKQSATEYRKDREEWSDAAIGCLLEAYMEKLTQLNRGNLRGRDWEEVAAAVSERCEKQSKSVEQCKNKVDNLKKRYKLERHRMSDGGITASHWPWFKKMEEIVGNSLPVKSVADEDKGGASPGAAVRQSKRYASATPSPVGQIIGLKSKSPKWRRVVFKISGAALACTGPPNIDPKVAMLIAREVSIACRLGVEVAIVVGGRNFFCGDSWVTATGLDRSTAYQIGMMASVMNSILLQSSLEKIGVQTRVQTAFSVQEVAEPYSRQRAIRHLEKGRVVIFGGIGAGTGNPLFSTDTAAALRASESIALSLPIFHNSVSGTLWHPFSVSHSISDTDQMQMRLFSSSFWTTMLHLSTSPLGS
ncbi:hypothetical protein DITRI_Ditri06bG0050600 [Diplodiscus trichospermus]